MTDETVNQEFKFLVTLKVLATEALLANHLNNPDFPKGFDIAKGLDVLKRALDAEIEFLQDHPEDYIEIYGEDN